MINLPFIRSKIRRKIRPRIRHTAKTIAKSPVGMANKSPTKKASKKLVFMTYLAYLVLGGIVFGTIAVFAIFAYFASDLPNPDRLLERSVELSTKLFDRNGEPIFEVYGEKNRSIIKLEDVSNHVLDAALATEDATFYEHSGFSLRGMVRAARNTLTGGGLQGGSTITQQVIKNTLLTQERTIVRKIKEFILSLQLENIYGKDQIFQMYLNETPYGGQNYGIFTASKAYFNKHPSELSIAEAAYLAGLPQSPSKYSHYGPTPDAGIARQKVVLGLMRDKGWVGSDGRRYYLSAEEYEESIEEELRFQAATIPFKAPHYVFYVRQQLEDMFGPELAFEGGLQVTTSLDLKLQEKAQEIVFEQTEAASYLGIGNGALVAIDPRDGSILAMVGSKGYFLDSEPEGCISGITGENSCTFESNVNVTTANRQPGSSIKPLTYATMLSRGYTAAFPFVDVETTFPGPTPDKPYIPKNYDGEFRGPMPLRKSLGNSINIAAVKALDIIGIEALMDTAKELGMTTLTDRSRFGLALTLGGGETKLIEMTGAFGSFANEGTFNAPTAILEVKNARGETIYKHRSEGKEVWDPGVAFLIWDILSDDGARSSVFGVGSALQIPGHRVAVKTGTTDDNRDNYAIGFTKSIVVGTWVGNNNNEEMNPNLVSGVSGATPIWRAFMIDYLTDKDVEEEK